MCRLQCGMQCGRVPGRSFRTERSFQSPVARRHLLEDTIVLSMTAKAYTVRSTMVEGHVAALILRRPGRGGFSRPAAEKAKQRTSL
jgi:hypothetical protein